MSEKIPKGWKKVKLGEVAEINMGQPPKSEFYNTEGKGLPFLQGNRTFGYRFSKIDTYCSNPVKIAKKGEILFSVRAPVADINIANQDICSEKFVLAHQGKINDISIYGQESNQTTWRLCKMNLAIRRIDSSQVKWNPKGSFLNDAKQNLIKKH